MVGEALGAFFDFGSLYAHISQEVEGLAPVVMMFFIYKDRGGVLE